MLDCWFPLQLHQKDHAGRRARPAPQTSIKQHKPTLSSIEIHTGLYLKILSQFPSEYFHSAHSNRNEQDLWCDLQLVIELLLQESQPLTLAGNKSRCSAYGCMREEYVLMPQCVGESYQYPVPGATRKKATSHTEVQVNTTGCFDGCGFYFECPNPI